MSNWWFDLNSHGKDPWYEEYLAWIIGFAVIVIPLGAVGALIYCIVSK